ncbi:2-oxoglutarate dehydrogenase E1 component [Magnetococcus marinus MC-1]|uniref:oxoglutarate dehydrogenase (succinyl-transferring) n=1 Tax=Magnetococcus marinus (strain ATCC BAA-1437 / JCM 17883 / MC-1) TaxID=156889 RepID=A0LAA2_MAGMM|nr:2-oxoglutarate dehydrogenase E1 component [Magnetococcus marinus]ABK44895.1 2-oxoglutarate dehydrogenase E1 component [Magnetococcus marinus MC-1]
MAGQLDALLNGTNALYISELYARYLDNPHAVDATWATTFGELTEDETPEIFKEIRGASWSKLESGILGKPLERDPDSQTRHAHFVQGVTQVAGTEPEQIRRATLDAIRALMMIRTYRVRGHLIANFDPLGLEAREHHPELDPANYGFAEEDMDRPIFIDYVLGLETATLRQIVRLLKETYCGTIGVEFMHIQEPEEKAWVQRRIESIRNRTHFTLKGKRTILQRLSESEGFETFLQLKYTGTKRFGLDGGESLIPAIEQILKRGTQLGLKEVVIGMAHRGRLNVLANIMRKPYAAIMHEFQGGSNKPDDVQGSGDVRYHLGASADRVFDDKKVHLSLTANPSHLELVNPVVLGKVRAKQLQRGDTSQQQVMGLIMHGDAAFAGQGLVPESLALSGLKGYQTGGTIHLIVNNQIGFTTNPRNSRSSPYPSDVAKMIQAPIFHVNGDDPEAVVHAARIAIEYRQAFSKDVVIDMWCYRRHGHNEGDEPSFTQPIMYRAIANHPTTRQVYAQKLEREGVLKEGEGEQIYKEFHNELETSFQEAQYFLPTSADWLDGMWKGVSNLRGEEEMHQHKTCVPERTLREVGKALYTPPQDFAVHRKIIRQLRSKEQMFESGEGFDWATGEALAFGTLLVEGIPVRLSGQDCGRGTFSQRHSVLIDQNDESRYEPLNHIRSLQADYEVIDSPLAEASVLGFEYGYASADPHALVLWEAQFGDFVNGAQMIIDQFISSGESKWLRLNGMVMLLPHGFEGQGPEHSSARPERFLQLCAEDNLQVCNLTTPANYFHALRRQNHRNFRKPLVIFTPKSLLRHKLCVSKLEAFISGSSFQRVYDEVDTLVADEAVKRVVLCSGKVYYELLQTRREQGSNDVAIVRIEQLYPWPRNALFKVLQRYANAEIVWCQEEPANMGYWSFLFQRLIHLLEDLQSKQRLPIYAGRGASASPASGLASKHLQEQTHLVHEALFVPLTEIPQPFRRKETVPVEK